MSGLQSLLASIAWHGGIYGCLVCCLLCLCLTAGRGWMHGGQCMYEATPAMCLGDEVDACGLRLET